jgi:AraC-like DNA-binding protein
MHRAGLTRAGFLSPIVEYLRRTGAAVDGLLTRALVPPWAHSDPEGLVPTASAARLLADAGRTLGLANVGLLAGRAARLEQLGVFGRLVRGSRTAGDALEAFIGNHGLFSSDGRMWLRARGDTLQLCHVFTSRFDRSDDGWRQVDHYVLMLMVDVLRLARAPSWRPVDVQFQTGDCPSLRDVEPLRDARLAFGQSATAVAFPRRLLGEPLPAADADVSVTPDGVEAWRATAPPRDFVASIVQAVETLSWDRYPDVHLTAEFLDMSVRTLQRHLAAAGLTHELLVGRSRFGTAAALLEDTDSKILDIALDLGYSDHAHFTRAFRRWAGCSPQEYRRRRRVVPGPTRRSA